MALNLTKQAEAAIRAKGMYEQFENRFSNYGAFNAHLDGAAALLPSSVSATRTAQNARDIYFPVLTKSTATIITANACTFSGENPTSAKPQYSHIWRGFAINVYPKVAANNYISLEDQYAQGMLNGTRSLLVNLDTYAAGQLESGKSTGLATTNLADVSVVSNAYQIAAASADKLYFYIPTLMERNDVNGSSLINVMTTEGRARMLDYESKSTGNDQNLRGVLDGSLPSASGYRHYRSNRATNGVGVSETHWVAPTGSIGVFTSVDSDAVAKLTSTDNKKLYTMSNPIIGVTFGVTEEPICDDLSATYGSGYESCVGTRFRFLAMFSFMKSYSSDTTSPIHKIEVME
jgi:hypothetical protein